MLFRPYRPIQIQLDPDAVRADSPEVAQRLNRIQDNYQLLESLFARVEAMLPDPPSDSLDHGERKTKKSPAHGSFVPARHKPRRSVKPR
jgi:hypothetical protein